MIDSNLTPSGGLSREDLMASLDAASTDDLELELAPAEDDATLDPLSGEAFDVDGLAIESDEPEPLPVIPHNGNLAAAMPEALRNRIVQDIWAAVSSDDNARAEWIRTYRRALDLLGFTFQTVSEPWEGASSSVHPLLAAATVAFQSRSITTLFPPAGPVRAKMLGPSTPFRETAAARAVTELNNLLTSNIEFRVELEKALFVCGLAGSGFTKTWKDMTHGRPTLGAIAPEDLILSPDATDVTNAARVTHVLKKQHYEIREAVAADVYIDVMDKIQERAPYEGGSVNQLTSSDIAEVRDEISGVDSGQDQRVVLHEVYLRMNLASYDEEYLEWDNPDGVARPYVLTYDSESMQMLGLYRNWDEQDLAEKALQPITQYQYLVSHLSPYGIGLMHLIGQTTENVTAILRNLTDAGTMANMQAGYKARGMRTREENTPLKPGEFRDVDVGSGKIADNIYPLNFKEPSATLHALMQGMISTGESLAAVAASKLEDLPHNAASFAVLAVLEREIEPQAAVHVRMHASFTHQLKQIAAIAAEMTPDYAYDTDGDDNTPAEPQLKRRDFTMAEFVPVSNPNEASAGTKLLKLEVVKQIAQAYPDQFNPDELVRYMVGMLGEPDFNRVLKTTQPPPYLDPISENMNLMTGMPVKAYPDQDHEAHLKVHMNAMQDPKLMQMMQNNPNAQTMQAAANAHIMEHMAFAYRRQMERQLGIPLPPPGQAMDPTQENRLSALAADAAERLLGLHQKEEALKQAQDPVFQLQQQEVQNDTRRLDIDEKDKATKNQIEVAKVILDAAAKDVELDLAGINTGIKAMQTATSTMSSAGKLNNENRAGQQAINDRGAEREAANAAQAAKPAKKD